MQKSAFTVRIFDRKAVSPPKHVTPWPPAFNESAPIDLEIGCGVGFHPIQYALKNPERCLIAIEHTREKFLSFQRRAQNHKLTNLHPVHADAIRYVTNVLKAESVDRIFLLYPNPEPQAANKRWFRMPFFHELLEKLKPGGTIELATNIQAYAEEAKLYATEFWHLECIGQLAIAASAEPRTHFEKKYLARGETCFDVTFLKP
jgi:tRNA (guanine-N7-)-methyltransferase